MVFEERGQFNPCWNGIDVIGGTNDNEADNVYAG
jgi:hypothetical protein